MKTVININYILAIGLFVIFSGCSDDDEVYPTPTVEDAAFTFSADPDNPNVLSFNAVESDNNWYTHWDFGDNSSAEGYEANKVFLSAGDYDVRFKVFTKGGSAESIQTIVVNQDFEGPNVLLNGEFNGSDDWTVLPISDGVDVNFDGDKAVWTGGNFGQVGIYQPVHVEANVPYQIDMEVTGGGLSDSWYEVYIGAETPVAGQDYADGGMRMGLNTWAGCGNEAFDASLREISCAGEGQGLVEFDKTGTVYLVIRGGGADYGSGLSLDNASMTPLVPGIEYTPPLFLPNADFNYNVTDFTVEFENTTSDANSYSWDFGDDIGTSTEENPTYTFPGDGIYTVTLTATNNDGSDEISQDITIGETNNLITNGTFTDDSNWTVVNQYEAANTLGSVAFENGEALFNQTSNTDWKHMGIYTPVELSPGTYKFDMDLTYTAINDIWGEVYIGSTEPVENTEYSGDQQVLIAYNAWDCPDATTYSGAATQTGCDGNDSPGEFEITSTGTYYLLFRTGGADYGSTGIAIDNVSLIKVN